MDKVTIEQRSRNMAAVHGKNTSPELRVRRVLHSMGFRFRLNRKDLPGKPDIVLPKYQLCIFVHGCFWHGHEGCSRSKRPATNKEFWNKKINGNMERDKYNIKKLEEEGWKTLTLWTCEIKDQQTLKNTLISFLDKD